MPPRFKPSLACERLMPTHPWGHGLLNKGLTCVLPLFILWGRPGSRGVWAGWARGGQGRGWSLRQGQEWGWGLGWEGLPPCAGLTTGPGLVKLDAWCGLPCHRQCPALPNLLSPRCVLLVGGCGVGPRLRHPLARDPPGASRCSSWEGVQGGVLKSRGGKVVGQLTPASHSNNRKWAEG